MKRTDYVLKQTTIPEIKIVIWGLKLVENQMLQQGYNKKAVVSVKNLYKDFIITGNKIADKKGL